MVMAIVMMMMMMRSGLEHSKFHRRRSSDLVAVYKIQMTRPNLNAHS